MSHYRANVRDLEFMLFEYLRLGEVLDTGAFGDLDVDAAHSMLTEFARLTEGPVAASFAQADRRPVEYVPDRHTITVPEALRRSVDALHDVQYGVLGLPEDLGGIPAPAPLVWATQEMVAAANPACLFFHMGPTMHAMLFEQGTEQQRRWATHALANRWGGTMVLTEPEAGSDVGAGRTSAVEQSDGTWHLTGIKRFISGGDIGDTAANILHMVLARSAGAPAGTKGLSLFVVPKVLFDPVTMELGERNGVLATGLEHKMGLKSSPTCELSFGLGGRPAIGYLVGDRHDGIAQMFRIIESARMVVGTKSTGTLSAGYLAALDYAKQRIQGADLARLGDREAPRVPIIAHPDVRRSLLTQKAWAEGLRALYLFTAAIGDPAVAEHRFGIDAATGRRINDLLLPVVKGVGSERAYEVLTESLQVFGGSGYLQDFPIEQYIRDTKIDSLYEGTTAIQAQDFVFRKIVRDQGVALGHVLGWIGDFCSDDAPDAPFAVERQRLTRALDDVAAMTQWLHGRLDAAADEPQEVYAVGLASVRYLMAMGDLVVGWLLLEQAVLASASVPDAGPIDRDYYTGKVAAACFFAANVLPLLAGVRAVVTSTDFEAMAVPENAF